MEETWCIVDKRKTPCVERSGYERDKRNRQQFFCTCAVCGNENFKYVKDKGQAVTRVRKKTGKGRKTKRKSKKLISRSEGAGIFDTVVGTAVDGLVHHGIPWMAKKSVKMGRYGASELMRNKNLQKKGVNYSVNKLTPFIQDSFGSTMDQLSTKVGPNKK